MTEKEKVGFFIATLDRYLAAGDPPDKALVKTVTDYALAFHPFAREAGVTLKLKDREIRFHPPEKEYDVRLPKP